MKEAAKDIRGSNITFTVGSWMCVVNMEIQRTKLKIHTNFFKGEKLTGRRLCHLFKVL